MKKLGNYSCFGWRHQQAFITPYLGIQSYLLWHSHTHRLVQCLENQLNKKGIPLVIHLSWKTKSYINKVQACLYTITMCKIIVCKPSTISHGNLTFLFVRAYIDTYAYRYGNIQPLHNYHHTKYKVSHTTIVTVYKEVWGFLPINITLNQPHISLQQFGSIS